MQPIDHLKALGVAALILTLDLACAFAAVWIYSLTIDPGHPRDYYVAAAPAISTVSTRVAGPLLFALLIWLFSRHRPDRNAWLFAAAVFVLYFLLDGAMVAFQGFFVTAVLATMALKLVGAMAGARLAQSRHQATPPTRP